MKCDLNEMLRHVGVFTDLVIGAQSVEGLFEQTPEINTIETTPYQWFHSELHETYQNAYVTHIEVHNDKLQLDVLVPNNSKQLAERVNRLLEEYGRAGFNEDSHFEDLRHDINEVLKEVI